MPCQITSSNWKNSIALIALPLRLPSMLRNLGQLRISSRFSGLFLQWGLLPAHYSTSDEEFAKQFSSCLENKKCCQKPILESFPDFLFPGVEISPNICLKFFFAKLVSRKIISELPIHQDLILKVLLIIIKFAFNLILYQQLVSPYVLCSCLNM